MHNAVVVFKPFTAFQHVCMKSARGQKGSKCYPVSIWQAHVVALFSMTWVSVQPDEGGMSATKAMISKCTEVHFLS